jgi:hypothetical protein
MRTLLRRAILAAVPAVALPVALLATPGTALAGAPPLSIHMTNQVGLFWRGRTAAVWTTTAS